MNAFDWLRYKAIPWFTALGFTSGTITLEVRGRASGRPVRVSLTQVHVGEARYLVSLGGESQWVRNVRAAGGQAVLLSRGRTPVKLVEVPVEARAPILLAYVNQRAFTHSGAQSARHFFWSRGASHAGGHAAPGRLLSRLSNPSRARYSLGDRPKIFEVAENLEDLYCPSISM